MHSVWSRIYGGLKCKGIGRKCHVIGKQDAKVLLTERILKTSNKSQDDYLKRFSGDRIKIFCNSRSSKSKGGMGYG